jgi:hypothetical protein
MAWKYFDHLQMTPQTWPYAVLTAQYIQTVSTTHNGAYFPRCNNFPVSFGEVHLLRGINLVAKITVTRICYSYITTRCVYAEQGM